MSQVGQSGSTQNNPVDYRSQPGAAGEAGSLDRVSAGALDQENIRFADQQTRNEVLRGQQLRAPALDVPDDVQPTALEAANTDIGDVSEITDKVLKSTGSLIQNGLNDELDPQQQQRLQQHADTLKGTANYLNALHGNGLNTPEGKRSVLAGLGYNMGQLEALLSLADPDDAGNSLASLHGTSLPAKKAALSNLGFSESQIEALLSLADPDDGGNALASLRQAGTNVKAALQALGFTATQAERLQALLNGLPSAGSAEQKQLLAQMGFSEEGAEVVLSNANPEAVRRQDALIRGTEAEQIAQLQSLAQSTSAFAAEGSNSLGVLEQLADIFMVLELLHEMAVQSRRTAREYRSAQYDAAKQEILNQADEMKKAAVHSLVAGVVSGAAKVAAGAVSAAGAFGGAKAKTPAGADATAQSQAQSAAMQQSMQRATAVSQMVQGTGDMAAAGFNYQAAQHTAKQKEHEAYQKTHDNAAQSASEFMQLHQDMVKTVQSKMDEIIRTWFETLKSTNRI